MEKFESLHAIFDEFNIRKSTAALYGISGLMQNGECYVETPDRPVHLENGYLPDIISEANSYDQFCSIFSDQFETTQVTQEQNSLQYEKLHSEREILSSEFEMDQGEPILTSEIQ